MIALAFMVGFVGIILLISGLAIMLRKRSYDQCSQPVTASVIYKRSHKGKNGWVYELQVIYTVDGIEYKKYLRTSGEDYASQSEGSRIELLYKPDNPKRAIRPISEKDQKNGGILSIVGAVMTLAGVALYFIGQMQ